MQIRTLFRTKSIPRVFPFKLGTVSTLSMCLLAVYFQVHPDAPVVLAMNRDERFDRPASPPRVDPGPPAVLAGVDLDAGGTWLGVNQFGLVAAVTNRAPNHGTAEFRSRGLLCMDLLKHGAAQAAADAAQAELQSGGYAPANFLCVDRHSCHVVSADNSHFVRRTLSPGLHMLTAGDPDNPHDARQQYARSLLPSADPAWIAQSTPAELLDRLGDQFATPVRPGTFASMTLREATGGTVSSTLLALTARTDEAIYRYAANSPDLAAYDDYSRQFRELLRG